MALDIEQRHEQLAEDVVQEAFERTLARIHARGFHATKSNGLRRFLFGVIKNVAREMAVAQGLRKPDHVLTWKPRPTDDRQLGTIAVTLDGYEAAEQRLALLAGLAKLTPRERAAHLRVDYRGDSYEEAATDMETTRTNVALLVYRARNKIAFYIEHDRMPRTDEHFGARKAMVKQAVKSKRSPRPITAKQAAQLTTARRVLAANRKAAAMAHA